jgi:hypothetical protein
MKRHLLSLTLALLVPASLCAQSNNASANGQANRSSGTKSGTTTVTPILDEGTQLWQQYVAKRDAMNAARAAAFAKTRTATTAKEKKNANDEVRKIEKDFIKDNADLIARLKQIDDQKKGPAPKRGG